jgi:predicted HAD superfamily hydrolase
MNSFDVFDTLIARRFMTSIPIFEQLGREFGIENFVAARMAADTGTRQLDEIYSTLNVGNDVKARELELEHEHCLPIQENLDRVAHGDLLISDMYMSGCDILSLLRSAGLNKQVTMYASNGGKRTGEVWKRLGDRKPDLHLGDNRASDFDIPRHFGFACELFEKSQFSDFELHVRNAGLTNIALLMREVRLRGNWGAYGIFGYVASQLNLPWLFAIAELIRRKSSRPKVFLGRDCQLLYLLYKNYFEYSYYLPFSRRLAFGQPEEAIRYLKSHAPEDAQYVDLCSTGATWEKLNQPLPILVAVYIDNMHYTKTRPILPEQFSYIMKSSESCRSTLTMELFNCGDHGYVKGLEIYDKNLFRATFSEHNDNDPDAVRAIQGPLRLALPLARFYKDKIRAELACLDEKRLLDLARFMLIGIANHDHLEQAIPARCQEALYLYGVIKVSADEETDFRLTEVG